MLQTPLPLVLWVTEEPRGGDLPLEVLFSLRERVRYFALVPDLAAQPWPGLGDSAVRAWVECQVTDLPLEASREQAGPHGKLILHNGGDAYGEPAGRQPVFCEPTCLRDLRDVAAARLADWPGRVGLNAGFSRDLAAPRVQPRGLARVGLEFSRFLWQKPGGGLLERRVREFSSRLETILTLWCRLSAW